MYLLPPVLACLVSLPGNLRQSSPSTLTRRIVAVIRRLPGKPSFTQLQKALGSDATAARPRYRYGEDDGFYSVITGKVAGWAVFTPNRVSHKRYSPQTLNEMSEHPKGAFLFRYTDRARTVFFSLVSAGESISDQLARRQVHDFTMGLGAPIRQAVLDGDGLSGLCALWKTSAGFVVYAQYGNVGGGIKVEDGSYSPVRYFDGS